MMMMTSAFSWCDDDAILFVGVYVLNVSSWAGLSVLRMFFSLNASFYFPG